MKCRPVWTYCVGKAFLEFLILLPLPPDLWDYWYIQSCQVG